MALSKTDYSKGTTNVDRNDGYKVGRYSAHRCGFLWTKMRNIYGIMRRKNVKIRQRVELMLVDLLFFIELCLQRIDNVQGEHSNMNQRISVHDIPHIYPINTKVNFMY